jgi:ABC-type branched-subunit amino acid transport system ATPase component
VTSSLTCSALSKRFGGNQAISSVELEIGSGDLVGLVGPNGAGKSTLLNLLTGHQVPDAGAVLVKGRDVTKRRPSHPWRHCMARTYQDGGVFHRLSALENVMVASVARGRSRAQAENSAREAAAELGLAPVLLERGDRLSGGQRKLVDFARTLVVDAELVLLDEPTSGVNPALAELMATKILERAQLGVGYLVVSHDLRWAFEVCTRIIVLATGRLLMEGTPHEVREDTRVIEAYLA